MTKYRLSLGTLATLVLSSSLSFAQGEVKLIRSENYDVCGYNTGCYEAKSALIQVRNLAYAKQVYVHHEMGNGVWIDIPAHYVRQADSVSELWVADVEFNSYVSYGNQFVLKYIVNGQTYWDNNNGANYTLVSSSQTGAGPMLGNDINVLVRQSSWDCSSGQLYAYIDVRNIAYAKTVALTYTTNDWATSTTVYGSYRPEYQTGYSSFIFFPDAYNIERWLVNAAVGCPSSLRYYIAYTVNGTTYYDNNYWANYQP